MALSKLCPEKLPAISWIQLKTRFSKLQVDFKGTDCLGKLFVRKRILTTPLCDIKNLRRLERVFCCCSGCETMEDYMKDI